MKKNLLQISMTLLLLICFKTESFTQGTNKTKLVYKDGDRNKGIEKIIFQNEQGAQVSEFDVQANNPFNKLPYTLKSKSSSGSNVYSVKSVDLPQNFQKFSRNGDVKMSSDFSLSKKDREHLAVTYNLVCSSGGDILMEGRESEIVVVKEGKEVSRIHLNSDAHDVNLSGGGEYAAFRANDHTEHELSTNLGFKIYHVETRELFYEKIQDVINISEYFGVLVIACHGVDRSLDLYCFSEANSSLYHKNFPDRIAAIDLIDNSTIVRSKINYSFIQDFNKIR